MNQQNLMKVENQLINATFS